MFPSVHGADMQVCASDALITALIPVLGTAPVMHSRWNPKFRSAMADYHIKTYSLVATTEKSIEQLLLSSVALKLQFQADSVNT
jgi:hypothetical protein